MVGDFGVGLRSTKHQSFGMESIKRVVNAASQALGSDKSAEDSQRAVFSGTTGFPAADFVFIQLKQQTDMLIVRKAFSEFINRPTDGLEAVLGVSPSLWCLIDPEAPSMIDFKSIEFSNTPDKIAFQQSSWQVMLYVKGDRYDRLFDFSRAFIDSLAGQTDLVRTYQAFDYRGGRDMTGFVVCKSNVTPTNSRQFL